MGLADISVFPMLWRVHEVYGFDNSPNLNNWFKAMMEVNGVNKTIVDPWWWW